MWERISTCLIMTRILMMIRLMQWFIFSNTFASKKCLKYIGNIFGLTFVLLIIFCLWFWTGNVNTVIIAEAILMMMRLIALCVLLKIWIFLRDLLFMRRKLFGNFHSFIYILFILRHILCEVSFSGDWAFLYTWSIFGWETTSWTNAFILTFANLPSWIAI